MMDWCCAIGHRKKVSMDCPAPKVYFFPVHFGWPCAGISSTGKKKRANYSSAFSICATISGCSRKSTIHARSVSSAIFLRLSHTSRWGVARDYSLVRTYCRFAATKVVLEVRLPSLTRRAGCWPAVRLSSDSSTAKNFRLAGPMCLTCATCGGLGARPTSEPSWLTSESLLFARRNEPSDQIFNRDDPTKPFVFVDDSREA